ncbi:MAG: hypothetical protein ABIT09_07730 [Croceibacterium sp.]
MTALEAREPAVDLGMPFFWFPKSQTYEQAKAHAGLSDHDGPVFAIRIVGVSPVARAA